MRERNPPRTSARKVRSSLERSLAPAGHSAVWEDTASRHRASMPSQKPGEETRPLRASKGWDPSVPLIRLPGQAEAVSPRRTKLKAHSLIDKVYDWKNLYRAWRKVRANKGAHGLDRVTIQMFESDLETHLQEIQRKLMEHRFEPHPVRRAYIPKPADPKKRRPLGIPTVRAYYGLTQ